MLSIGVVARQSGLEISTLRKWEARYGFPQPQRRESGQRVYLKDDVEALRLIARRLATGERVGRVIRELLAARSSSPGIDASAPPPAERSLQVEQALATLREAGPYEITKLLETQRHKLAMRDYVENFISPLTCAVGESWVAGTLPIHREHLYTSLVESLLLREADELNHRKVSQILLTTPAGEKHTLGLSMVHAVLADAGISSLRVTSDLPVAEIAAACMAHDFRAVGLSASVHYPPRLLREQIAQLRALLTPETELWLGGSGIDRISRLPPGVRFFSSLSELIEIARTLIRSSSFR
jgi:DNA-binding transcriptional MerR regulator/methylmalonyl-CoA mutase cobalamin-binding subunit